MDIRNIANQGSVDRVSDRADRADRAKSEGERDVVLVPVAKDHATISAKGRDSLAAIEGLAERARNAGRDRAAIVEAAKARLLSGELALPPAFDKAAQGLLDADFLAG